MQRKKELAYILLLLAIAALPQMGDPFLRHLTGGAKEYKMHLQYVREARRKQPELVLLGDSLIKQSRKQIMGNAPVKALNFGFPGDDVRSLRWRLEHGELATNPPAAILMIGTNDLTRGAKPNEIAREIDSLLASLRERHPDMQVLVLGILPRGQTPSHHMRAKVVAVNQELGKSAERHAMRYLDIGPLFLDSEGNLNPELVNKDMLHITRQGYNVWARAIKPELAAILPDPIKPAAWY